LSPGRTPATPSQQAFDNLGQSRVGFIPPDIARAEDLAFGMLSEFQYDQYTGEYVWRYGGSSWVASIRWNPRLEQMWVKTLASGKEYGPTPCSVGQFNDLAARSSKGQGVNAVWAAFRGAGYLGIVGPRR